MRWNEIDDTYPFGVLCDLRDLMHAMANRAAAIQPLSGTTAGLLGHRRIRRPRGVPTLHSTNPMKFSDYCLRARFFRTISGKAHYVCEVAGRYLVTDNPPSFYPIKYIATAPQQHPLEA